MKIPQQLLAPIVGVLAGCFGIGVGLIIRQPEINELHRQVAKLQKKADELKETVRKQNDEISALITRYRALQVWQVIQKYDLRKQIEESLVFQYAMNDSTPLPQTHKSAAEQVVQLAAHPAPSGIDSSLQQQRVH